MTRRDTLFKKIDLNFYYFIILNYKIRFLCILNIITKSILYNKSVDHNLYQNAYSEYSLFFCFIEIEIFFPCQMIFFNRKNSINIK